MKIVIIPLSILVVSSLVSCEKTKSTSENKQPQADFEKFFTSEEITNSQDIHVARTTAKPGDEITIRGEVIGRKKVFVDGRASFIVGDPTKLTSCDKVPDDPCTTPWDACCDGKELKRIGIASVQILGEDGRVLSGELKGTKGLKELSYVTVSGVVAETSTEDNLIINASKIHVKED